MERQTSSLDLEEKKDIIWELHEALLKDKGVDVDFYLKNNEMPLGTLSKPAWMFKGDIPKEEVYSIPMSKPYEPEPAMCLGIAGCGKTYFMKRAMYYYYKKGYNTFIFEPKEEEWINARNKPANRGLAPNEKPDSIDIIGLAPSYIFVKHPINSLGKNYINVSLNLKKLRHQDYREFWVSLGLTEYTTDWVREKLEKYSTINDFIDMLKTSKELGSAGKHLYNRLSPLKNDILFNKVYYKKIVDTVYKIDFKELDSELIKLLWKKRKAILLTFVYPDKRYLPAYFYYMMKTFHDITIEYEFKNEGKIHKKFIGIDDCNYFVPINSNNPAVEMGIISLVTWRKHGFEMWFATQHPKMVNEQIIANCKHFFIYNIGLPESMKFIIKDPKIYKLILNLKYNIHKKIVQVMHLQADGKTYKIFYPFLSPIGHFKSTEGK